jgi:riboflavin kinase/FMN adenylyltransferase
MPIEIPLHLDDQNKAPRLAPDVSRGTAAVIGNFDGVHLGHQALFARAVAEAKAQGLVPVALTFDPHPSLVLGKNAPGMLTTLTRKAELLARLGAAHIFVRRFDTSFSAWSPRRFVEQLLVGELSAKVVVSGNNFRFGHNREGNSELLSLLGRELGFVAHTAEARDDRGALSSTRARDAILQGDLIDAESILGRRHAIEGLVEKGDQRGRTIGFPTANLSAGSLVLPPNGVYAVLVDILTPEGPRTLAPGVMNIGVRPTVSAEGTRSVEVHLFDLAQDLYGQTLRAHVIHRLRAEKRFDGLDALKAQLTKDAHEARSLTVALTPRGDAYG